MAMMNDLARGGLGGEIPSPPNGPGGPGGKICLHSFSKQSINHRYFKVL